MGSWNFVVRRSTKGSCFPGFVVYHDIINVFLEYSISINRTSHFELIFRLVLSNIYHEVHLRPPHDLVSRLSLPIRHRRRPRQHLPIIQPKPQRHRLRLPPRRRHDQLLLLLTQRLDRRHQRNRSPRLGRPPHQLRHLLQRQRRLCRELHLEYMRHDHVQRCEKCNGERSR